MTFLVEADRKTTKCCLHGLPHLENPWKDNYNLSNYNAMCNKNY